MTAAALWTLTPKLPMRLCESVAELPRQAARAAPESSSTWLKGVRVAIA